MFYRLLTNVLMLVFNLKTIDQMNKQEELDKLFTRFILVCISSEVIAQRLLSQDLVIRDIANNTSDIINSPIDMLYSDIIDNFNDLQLDKIANDEMEIEDITTPEEWSDMITDLVKDIKEHYYLSGKSEN